MIGLFSLKYFVQLKESIYCIPYYELLDVKPLNLYRSLNKGDMHIVDFIISVIMSFKCFCGPELSSFHILDIECGKDLLLKSITVLYSLSLLANLKLISDFFL